MFGDRPANERGQLLVITALVLAVVLVGLALVLNSAIYTENLSTRQSTDSIGATTAIGMGQAEIERTIHHVNRYNNASEDEVNRAFDDTISDISNNTTDAYAKRGTSYRFEVIDRTNGTHLKHTNSSKSFVSGGLNPDKGDWRLASNVPRVRGYTMTVTRDDLYTSGLISSLDDFNDEGFYIRFEDSNGNAWEVYLVDDDNNVTVIGGDPDNLDNDSLVLDDLPMFDEEGCTVAATTSEQVAINFTQGTIGQVGSTDRTYCPGLDFQNALTGDLTVYHRNADDDSNNDSRSGGTYELVLGTTTYNSDHFYDTGYDQSPYATDIIYSVRVESHYARADIAHSRTVRLYPGIETYVA
jgi:hypothetical protein